MSCRAPLSWTRRFLVLATVGFTVAAGCGGEGRQGRGGRPGAGGAESGPGPERRVLVDVAEVETGDVADHLVTSGTLESEFQADLFPEATGIVRRIDVEEGQVVRAGQTLAVITSPSLDAGAQRAQVDISKARRAVEEAERLHASGAISDKELQDARDALSLSQASYSEATRSAGFARISSPIAGTVSVRELRVGELATSGRRAFQVVDLDKLQVVVQLPERDLTRISHQQECLLTSAYDDELQAPGHITRISPVVDPATGTVKVTIAVDPGQTVLRPGQYVKVRVEVDRHSGVKTIPRRALVWDDGEPVAWLVVDKEAPEPAEVDGEEEAEASDDGGGFLAQLFGGDEESGEGEEDDEKDPWEGIPRRGVEKARLTIGYSDTERVEVEDGLELGQQVVVVGNGGLRAETLVKLPEDPDPAPDKDEETDKGGDPAPADEAIDGAPAEDAQDAEAADNEAADNEAADDGDEG